MNEDHEALLKHIRHAMVMGEGVSINPEGVKLFIEIIKQSKAHRDKGKEALELAIEMHKEQSRRARLLIGIQIAAVLGMILFILGVSP